MQLSEFDYDLPQGLIATHPTDNRRASRLLCLPGDGQATDDRQFVDLPNLLRPNDLLVFNDTRVIKARLHGHKETGGRVEILLERVLDELMALAHIKASKSPKIDSRIKLAAGCTATVVGRESGLFVLRFTTGIAPFLERHGEVPLPPYLGRDAESADDERYQTVYAKVEGAVAAPTAGLHFDYKMLRQLADMGVRQCFVTLHVGAGTFQSLREENLQANHLHAEQLTVDDTVCAAVADTRKLGGRIVAVGTTSVRALETASANGSLRPINGETDLFIVPGYEFRSVDCMITNFHLPQSSLLMLVAAFAGRSRVLAAYRHAVREKYRFFSYGDAMFIESRSPAFS